MTTYDIEDRLVASLAARVARLEAPPGPAARRAVAARAGALSRRRRATRTAAAAAVAATALASGGLVRAGFEGGDPPAVVSGPGPAPWDPPAPGRALPAFAIDGLVPTYAEASSTVGGSGGGTVPGNLQVFRRPEHLAGPTIHVSDLGPTDARPDTLPGRPVRLAGGEPAGLVTDGTPRSELSWHTDDGRLVVARAWAVTPEELTALAGGLVPRVGGPGLDATVLPAGLAEDPIDPAPGDVGGGDALRHRTLSGTDAGGHLAFGVTRLDEAFFEATLLRRLETAATAEELIVAGRPAVLIRHRDAERWTLLWRPSTADTVEADIVLPPETSIEEVLASLRPVGAAEWDRLVADAAAHRAAEADSRSSDVTSVDATAPD